jgi:hypothetical protein
MFTYILNYGKNLKIVFSYDFKDSTTISVLYLFHKSLFFKFQVHIFLDTRKT